MKRKVGLLKRSIVLINLREKRGKLKVSIGNERGDITIDATNMRKIEKNNTNNSMSINLTT